MSLFNKTPAERHKAKFGSRDKDIPLKSKTIGPSKDTLKNMFTGLKKVKSLMGKDK